jgi:hypothetical protein
MFQNILCSYVPFRKNNNNPVKLEIKLSLETENSCAMIINTTRSSSFQIERRKGKMSTAPKIFKSDPIWHDNGKLQINLVQFKSSLHAQRWSPFVKVGLCCLLNHVIHLT